MSAVLKEIENPEDQFEQSALSIRDEAKALHIQDQETYDRAAAKFNGVCALEKEITGHYGPMKDAAHKAHKAVCDAEKEILAPVQEAKRILSRSIGAWDAEQERKRQEEQRRLEAEARRIAEEEALAAAVEVEQAGGDIEEVEAVLSTPVPIMRPSAPPTYEKSATVSTREVWSAELVSIQALVKAAMSNPAYLPYLQANMTALNSTARAQKSAFSVPGVKVNCERIAAGRGR
jgi:hypothetical protein